MSPIIIVGTVFVVLGCVVCYSECISDICVDDTMPIEPVVMNPVTEI